VVSGFSRTVISSVVFADRDGPPEGGHNVGW